MIKEVTSRLHITFKSLHIHFSQFKSSLRISHKFSSFYILTTHDPWAETANGRSPLLDWNHGEKENQKLTD